MAKQEYEGVAFSSVTKDGVVINVTERAGSSLEAFENLEATLVNKAEEGWSSFVSYYNKANDQPTVAPLPVTPVDEVPQASVVATAVEMGGEIIQPATIENFPVDAADSTSIGDGTLYMGLKASKLDAIGENQSYEVMANCYSYDTTKNNFVNFFNGTKPAAGHGYGSEYGQKLFKDMFPLFVPVDGADHSPIPTGPVKLYVVGVKGKDNKIYQNIKSVEPT